MELVPHLQQPVVPGLACAVLYFTAFPIFIPIVVSQVNDVLVTNSQVDHQNIPDIHDTHGANFPLYPCQNLLPPSVAYRCDSVAWWLPDWNNLKLSVNWQNGEVEVYWMC